MIAPTSAREHHDQALGVGQLGGVQDPLADRLGDLGRQQGADEVGDTGEHEGDPGRQRPGRHRRGDGVGRVVEAVGVVEGQGDDDDRDQAGVGPRHAVRTP